MINNKLQIGHERTNLQVVSILHTYDGSLCVM